MGRKSKAPVKVQLLRGNETIQTPSDELPAFRKFIDVSNGRAGPKEKITRLYFETPTHAEVVAAKASIHRVMGGNSGMRGVRSIGIGDYAAQKISVEFGRQLVQLIIHSLRGKYQSASSLSCISSAIKRWLNYLAHALHDRRLTNLTIYNLEFEDWLAYRAYLEQSKLGDKKRAFFDVLAIFSTFPPTSFNGSLRNITAPKKRSTNAAQRGHASIFAQQDGAYSDAVMYQLLAQFLYRFKRQIGYLKYYDQLTIEGMGKDWLSPDRKAWNPKRASSRSDSFLLLDKWLSDEEGYRKILDHKLLWCKCGFHSKQQFTHKISGFTKGCNKLLVKYNAYVEWERRTHMLPVIAARSNVFGLYVIRSVADDRTGSQSQLAFCLANIVMIYTGLNKEVVLSWPSQVNGKSILDQADTLFVKDESAPREVEITGIKGKTGALTKDKPVRVAIVIGSPLYDMLKEYEAYVKTDWEGPFFELNPTVQKDWGKNLEERYPVIGSDGKLLKGLQTKRFRKVFATGKMMEHLQGVTNAQELADRLRSDLDHERLDITLSHYIMRSHNATAVLDIAIAAITSEKIRKAIQFEGTIALAKPKKLAKSVYLCECADPKKPTHGFAIAKECTYYDLCLGCKRSIICAKHLPYICLRILQYEEKRNLMGKEWSAIYEDRWMIAMDALNKYRERDKKNGETLVENAWFQARTGMVSLPPILMTNI